MKIQIKKNKKRRDTRQKRTLKAYEENKNKIIKKRDNNSRTMTNRNK